MADQALAPDRSLIVLPKAASPRARSVTNRQYRKLAIGIALTDAAALAVAIVLAAVARSSLPLGAAFVKLLVIAPFVWIVIFAAFELYAIPRLSPAEEFRRILEATGVGVGVTLAAALMLSHRALSVLTDGWIVLTDRKSVV